MKNFNRPRRTNYYIDRTSEKKRSQEWKREHDAGGFRCAHCKKWVIINEYMGTVNRNHCPMCLWSKHVDENKGDREALCHGGMRPIGLTFKHDGWGRQGELMLVHECAGCLKISINRIARDDSNEQIATVFQGSFSNQGQRRLLAHQNINLLSRAEEHEVYSQLFGVR